MGYLHALRPGRPALALDLMEELRAPLADRLVNHGQLTPDDFIERPGGAVRLTKEGRATLLAAYQKRKQEEVFHTVVDAKVPVVEPLAAKVAMLRREAGFYEEKVL